MILATPISKTELPSITLRLRFPLVSVEVVQLALDRPRSEILDLILEGQLQYAFDLRTRDASRQLIRVFYQSVLEFKTGLRGVADDVRAVVAAVLPLKGAHPTGIFLSNTWSVSPDHISALGSDGSVQNLDKPRRGRGGSPRFERSSVSAFLESRRMPI